MLLWYFSYCFLIYYNFPIGTRWLQVWGKKKESSRRTGYKSSEGLMAAVRQVKMRRRSRVGRQNLRPNDRLYPGYVGGHPRVDARCIGKTTVPTERSNPHLFLETCSRLIYSQRSPGVALWTDCDEIFTRGKSIQEQKGGYISCNNAPYIIYIPEKCGV